MGFFFCCGRWAPQWTALNELRGHLTVCHPVLLSDYLDLYDYELLEERDMLSSALEELICGSHHMWHLVARIWSV